MGHEINVFGPDHGRRHDQVTFVLPALIVNQYDHTTGTDVFDEFRNSIKFHLLVFLSAWLNAVVF